MEAIHRIIKDIEQIAIALVLTFLLLNLLAKLAWDDWCKRWRSNNRNRSDSK